NKQVEKPNNCRCFHPGELQEESNLSLAEVTGSSQTTKPNTEKDDGNMCFVLIDFKELGDGRLTQEVIFPSPEVVNREQDQPDTQGSCEMNNKHYSCDVCGKNFTNPGCLHIHLKLHTGIRDFKCKDCGKTFLIVQVRTHSGERPYSFNDLQTEKRKCSNSVELPLGY
uniref:C2H2-type domain-containing protein n=1 Tax=Dicentrarchus labrax TaxID=13489 RepID=A0A8C4ETX4_DICLA